MPHFHLSLQAGDDMILKRMKRRHLRADAVAFCETVRRERPDAVFGADLIAGFPTESEAMFANTLRLAEDCGLTFLHVFPFSRAAGHAGRPDAAIGERRGEGAGGPAARRGRTPAFGLSRRRDRAHAVRPGRARREADGRSISRPSASTAWRPEPSCRSGSPGDPGGNLLQRHWNRRPEP